MRRQLAVEPAGLYSALVKGGVSNGYGVEGINGSLV
jgi:hypothetical protein